MTNSPGLSAPRIPPRPRESWDAEVFQALAVLTPPGRRAPASAAPEGAGPESAASGSAASDESSPRPVSNILGTFAWHPALTKGWLLFNNHLFHSTLSARVRELVTVRIAWLRQGEYEWAQHVRMARNAGMSAEEVEAISEGPDAAVWGALDAALLRSVDELCRDRNISDTTWAQLSDHLDRQQLMDVVFTVGAYDMLAMSMNTFGLKLDADLEGFPS
jgi:alkylhydroperoxidase family enzyme